MDLHADPLIRAYLRQPAPNPQFPKAAPGWFERMAAGLDAMGDWVGGVVAGDFNENPTMSQIITNTVITMIPLVDQAADLRDISAGVYLLAWRENGYKDYLAWAGLGMTIVGLFPTVGSLAKGVLKGIFHRFPLEGLVKVFNKLAEGHAGKYLKALQNGGLKTLCAKTIKKTREILDGLYTQLHKLRDRVPGFLVNIKDKIDSLLFALDRCAKQVNRMITRLFDDLTAKLNHALGGKFE